MNNVVARKRAPQRRIARPRRLWTPQELDVVETLTRRLRLLALPQALAIWWPQAETLATVRDAIRPLIDAGLIYRTQLMASLLTAQAPLYSWRPGQEEPDARAVSRRARERWQALPEPHDVLWATSRAANLFGSTVSGLPRPEHWGHDLLLADVYMLYRCQWPQLGNLWHGEHCFPKAGYRLKDPDAFLVDGDGRISRIVESAGRYTAAQVESFHAHCAANELPYELW